ncbi:hypothetical protein CKO36_11185 [Rhabdochromatium marinum]|nr:hypothetical protein [Rhabdochromatium marinum]
MLIGLLSALFGVTSLALTGLIPWAQYPGLLATWWTGDSVGILILTPWLLALTQKEKKLKFSAETALFTVALMIATLFSLGLFGTLIGPAGMIALLPLIMWAVFRFNASIVFGSVVFICMAAILATIQPTLLFAPSARNMALIELQLFLAVLALTTQVLFAVVREHELVDQALRLANEQLDRQVHARTAKLEASQARMRTLIDHLDAGVVVHAPDTAILLANPAAGRLLGVTEQVMRGRHADDGVWRFINEDGSQLHQSDYPVMRIIESKAPLHNQVLGAISPGHTDPHWLMANGSPLYDAKGALLEIVISFLEITELKHAEQRLLHLAHHDTLTGVPNRMQLNVQLEQAIERAKRQQSHLALIFVDLDRFKSVNDRLGHQAGDALLKQVATRLKTPLRGQDTVARISGDEFVVLLEDLASAEDAGMVAEKLLACLGEAMTIADESLLVSASLGISLYPRDGTDADTLLRNADLAMYSAKEDGRNTYRFFQAEFAKIALENARIYEALGKAIQNDAFDLVYQPQLELTSSALIGVEALLRWRDPELGDIPPERIIEIAERNGLINAIGDWVLRRACHQARQWLDCQIEFGRIAVNLSGQQLRANDFDAHLSAILTATGCPASCLELEITESFVMHQMELAIEQLERVRTLDVTLAVDNFGTGYSSLSYLKQLPVNKIKIDRSFIECIHQGYNDKAIAASIIALGHALEKIVVAVGVETAAQAAFLWRQGCDQVQGFLYGSPEPPQQLEKRLQKSAAETF